MYSGLRFLFNVHTLLPKQVQWEREGRIEREGEGGGGKGWGRREGGGERGEDRERGGEGDVEGFGDLRWW